MWLAKLLYAALAAVALLFSILYLPEFSVCLLMTVLLIPICLFGLSWWEKRHLHLTLDASASADPTKYDVALHGAFAQSLSPSDQHDIHSNPRYTHDHKRNHLFGAASQSVRERTCKAVIFGKAGTLWASDISSLTSTDL